MAERDEAVMLARVRTPVSSVSPRHGVLVKDESASSTGSPTLQIGIASMLVLVVVAALISAGLVYAARIPEIQEEWSVLFGTKVTADRSRRGPQILFILFTVTSPLLIAMTLSLTTSLWTWLSKR
ncbi:hypothetical protein [Allorhodopirellula heiligendammensis]|uniref:Uncharacterized protein n=1 Tax=Allorhodopirellula heiligendammensis TaxID=2714739 RepID=A0A5C6BWY1_9BACT|nr:hypothetical protein [Allorhodopirellula heiligendammensis]TWU15304.1 hypothetical protein Poly21_24990 [Allorhodopirellula heiligendammensis]